MKKILILVFISIFFYNKGFAVLSKAYWNEIYLGCIQKDTNDPGFKAYCSCYVNKFNSNFSDKSLENFLKTAGPLIDNPTVRKYAKECLPLLKR
tara:strand:- start:806 stop:1087 length:282 start_codon:yes stop_codon:yes gene_type:complete